MIRGATTLLLLSPLVVMAACGGDDSGASDEEGAASAKFPTDPITITVWDTAEDTKNNLFNDTIIPAYEKIHPNVTVDYSFYDTGALASKEFVALGNGTGPTVFSVQGVNMPKMYAADFLAPAEDAYFKGSSVEDFLKKYIRGSLSAQMQDDTLYALPNQQNANSLYINTELFREAGLDPQKDVPKTWADVERLNGILTKQSGEQVEQKGFDFRYTAGSIWFPETFIPLLYQAGGALLNDAGEPDWDGPAGIRAMNEWKRTVVAPEISNNTGSSPYTDFAEGFQVMDVGPPNEGRYAEALNPDLKGNYAVVPLPQIDPDQPVNYSYSFNLAVNADASPEEQHVGWDFVRFALKDPAQWWSATAMLQPRVDLQEALTGQGAQVVGVDTFLQDLEISRPAPATEHWDVLERAVTSATEGIMLEDQDPEAALSAAADEYKSAAGL